MALSTDASPPPSLGEEPLPHDGNGYDLNDDDGASFGDVSLDDEGFPSQLPGSETPSKKSSFTADFYRCGTDWSSLMLQDDKNNRHSDFERDSGKKMKQANLFQIWGFKRSDVVGLVESGPSLSVYSDKGGSSSERKIVKRGNWGSISRNGGKESENTTSLPKRKRFSGENRATRSCPFYKKIPGTTFTVDAFRYGSVEGCSAYFLSHFHCDHYGGLSKKWSHGPIYCSPLTGRLVQMCLSIAQLHELTNQTALDHVFHIAFLIGKECVYLAISKALGVKIYANASRRRILQAFDWSDLSDRLCTIGMNTLLHVLPMSSLRPETLKEYLKTYKDQFTAVLAFRPTGVPYSEHSSYTELRDFVQFLRPDKIIPTVNVGNAANREKMQSYFRDWLRC
ncbi:hypothetical protein V8G54_022033 [Vigna mungo]|uniref:DNA repair metallo-beta-lactamase domain-containing protein n=1 Tax=Vigna mungo TaxID=3915 RepID=A0AAQ3RWC1_VIGMU